MRSFASLGGSHLAFVVVGVMKQEPGIWGSLGLMRSESAIRRWGDEVVTALIILFPLRAS